jgi:serine/threonine-protein kinase
MSLASGTRLGPYEIVSPLGAGGMGEVYRATDTNLARQVAIKVLPEMVAADAERLARFDREARTLAALNHPNIAAIYGLERTGATTALVMELVDGPTLADRIAQGRIPVEEALPIARQIAEALEAAHEMGIVHRDLKPANIKVRPDGTVKVLDFGLAKFAGPPEAGSHTAPDVGAGFSRPDASMSPTITSPAMMTGLGIILGTAAYMSPEQARGRPVDKRTDVWAFGAVLYEMLTGARAFDGDDVTEMIAAVVKTTPNWSAIPADVPPRLVSLIQHCLEKDRKVRIGDIAVARFVLAEHDPRGASATAAPPRRRWTSPWVAASTIAVIVLAGVAVAQTVRLARAVPTPAGPVRFEIAPPAGVQVDDNAPAVMSPDGNRLVRELTRGQVSQLFMRRLDQDEATPIAGTEGGSRPFFSPDGKWIGFNVQGALKKVAVDGGAAVDIGRSDFGTAAWAPDDTIVLTPNYSAGLWRVAASGGTQQKLTEPDTKDGELGHFWPQILPDGRTVLFTSFRTPAGRSRIETYSLDTGARKVIVDGGFYGRYVASGHILFARSTTVFAAPFDLASQETTAPAVPVIADVAVNLPSGLAQFSVSPGGTLAYVTQSALGPPRRLAWVDRTGRVSPASDAKRRFADPRLSPDGRRLALTIRDEQDADVWVHDLARGTFGRVTSSPTTQSSPVWTPDGRRLFFVFEEPVFHIYSRLLDGGAEPERILDGPFDLTPLSVSPDGGILVYRRSDPSTRGGIWLLPLTGDRKPRAFVDTPASEDEGGVSPDGSWLAYRSDETGRDEVYLRSFPDGVERVQVSTNGGRTARWSRDGRDVFFREGDKLMAASVRGREVGRPVMLFEKPWGGYDVTPDGRFIAVLPDDDTPPAPVRIVLNWFEELRRLVPAK